MDWYQIIMLIAAGITILGFFYMIIRNFRTDMKEGFRSINDRLDRIEIRMDRLENRIDKLESRISRVEGDLLVVKTTMQIRGWYMGNEAHHLHDLE